MLLNSEDEKKILTFKDIIRITYSKKTFVTNISCVDFHIFPWGSELSGENSGTPEDNRVPYRIRWGLKFLRVVF